MLGRGLVVGQRFLVAQIVGSNPTDPANNNFKKLLVNDLSKYNELVPPFVPTFHLDLDLGTIGSGSLNNPNAI